ncbi:monovalent cation/H+ antiporter complex subunit F [Zhihengliuella halotolerans]|uniref:Multicomponent Na+:H+ antiporter subunit F n=1 Tax=Zhihengliuella halotolerans TaxID=370736 RepID=A0A4Q8AF79_9MICC|nr:monovalent cation/H+ antiporter complex subunit F [Zhihengliuella halotolerans]MCO1338847.1 transporter [Kocuria polaris]RZU62962.1 multicomponent Na+:H+ antiporter subunit F [Zhihengliuella halotolerans]
MIIALWTALGLLAVSVIVGLVAIARAVDGASRAVVGDLVFFCCVGFLVLIGLFTHSAVSMDAALLASLLGILATIALARILTRGRR